MEIKSHIALFYYFICGYFEKNIWVMPNGYDDESYIWLDVCDFF